MKLRFLEKSLETVHSLRNAHDYKANILLGISGAMLLFSITEYNFLALFSLFSAIFCIMVITLPQRSLRKNPLTKNIFCWWGIKNLKYPEYLEYIKKKINNEEDLILEYTKEIYALSRNSLRYKSIFIKLATLFLLAGLISLVFEIF